MAYQHPLAYLLGLEGLALLRTWAGEFDEDFVHRRFAEIRRLLATDALACHDGLLVGHADAPAGYRQWSAHYDDEPRHNLFDFDEPTMQEIFDTIVPGEALDAACGTGRFADRLTELGHQVIGVDSSPEMLTRAALRVPSAEFRLGELHELPVADSSIDLVVCGLALSHVPDLRPVMAEFARVLRQGGHLAISDVHEAAMLRGSPPRILGPDGRPSLVASYRHSTGDFLRAALPLGLVVRRCEEPGLHDDPEARWQDPDPPAELAVTGWDNRPWSLMDLIPEAARAAWAVPTVIIWLFELPSVKNQHLASIHRPILVGRFRSDFCRRSFPG